MDKNGTMGTSLVAQWLRLHTHYAEEPGFDPGQGTKIPHAAIKSLHPTTEDPHGEAKILHVATKIPCATAKTQCSQINLKKKNTMRQ